MLEYVSFPDDITVVYGPAASGKTTLCLQLVASNPGKVIFVDTENTFNVERLQKMNPLVDLSNVILISAKRYSEQYRAVKSVLQMKNVSVVIVDSFTKYYRAKLQQKVVIQPPTIRMLKMLRELKVPILLTSQVYNNFKGEIKTIGGDLFGRYASQMIRLEHKNERRQLVNERTGVKIPFIITNRGLMP